MARIIFDIETAGRDFKSLDIPTQEYLLRFAETEEEKEEVRDSLSFYPQTAEIVAIGMLDPIRRRVLYSIRIVTSLCCRSKRKGCVMKPEQKKR